MKKLLSQFNNTIFQWYLKLFTAASLIFAITLIPLTIHLQKTFIDLQLQKFENRLASGIATLDTTVTSLVNIPQILNADSSFIGFGLPRAYPAMSADTKLQMRNTFSGLTYPLSLVTDIAIQSGENAVITSRHLFFADSDTSYYPDFFCVDDLTAAEWRQLLSDYKSGFMPLHHVKTPDKEYDALIYVVKWTNTANIYACLNIADIADLLFEKPEQNYCYFSITASDNHCLYTNLSAGNENTHTISKQTTLGGLSISIHIANELFYQKMQPLYFFLAVYFTACILLFVFTVFAGSHISTKPFQNIIQTLDSTVNQKPADCENQALYNRNGFDYIAESIHNAQHTLHYYENALYNQNKILQARFLEKAINGQLSGSDDLDLFHTYFPDFPASYCLMLFRIKCNVESTEASYANPLLLLQTYLQSELQNTYLQQINASDLLLIISEDDYARQTAVLEYLIENVNREEPSYCVNCVASKFYKQLENLPAAYRQLQQMIKQPFTGSLHLIHTLLECPNLSTTPVYMMDLLTLYTAITHGNREIAINTLHSFTQNLDLEENTVWDQQVYEMIRAVLTCVLHEHPLQLIDQNIPPYRTDVTLRTNNISSVQNSLYTQLTELVGTFCDLIRNYSDLEPVPFSKELLQYVDTHYTEYDLCITTLEGHFKRSSSYIRQVFKDMTGITLSKYVEQKRMQHANMLLAQNEKNMEKIALECGYASSNTFCRAYKRVYGHSPTDPTCSV